MCRAVWSKGIQRSGLRGFKVPACLCTSHASARLSLANIRTSAICKWLEQDSFSSGTWGVLGSSPSGFGPHPCAPSAALGEQPCALRFGHQVAVLHSSTKCNRARVRKKDPPFPPWTSTGMSLWWDPGGRGLSPSLCALEPCSAPTPFSADGDSG